MPKTPPSRADLELIARLAEEDIHVSRGQLDRWRQHGLLPRTMVQRLGAHGSSAQHDEKTYVIAGALGSCARRGVSWHELGLALLLIGEPPAPDVLRECLQWALNGLEVDEQDPSRNVEELVEAEWRSQGPIFENFQALAMQAGLKDATQRNEFVYALIQARLGEAFGLEQEADIEAGVAQWKAARVGAEAALAVSAVRLTPQLLSESRELLATASDHELEVTSYITYIVQFLSLEQLGHESHARVLGAQSPTALGLKLLHNIKTVRETGKRPLDLLVELLVHRPDRERDWALTKIRSLARASKDEHVELPGSRS